MNQSWENSKKPNFWSILGPNLARLAPNFFFRKIGLHYTWGSIVTHLCTKNQKKLMKQSWENSKKPYFWSILGPNWAQLAPKNFFRKFRLHYTWGIIVTHLCPKIEKNLMSQSPENSEKPYFWSILGPNWAQLAPKYFFRKIGLL